MDDALVTLTGAVDVDAKGVTLAVEADERLTTNGALAGESPLGKICGPLRQYRADDLGDHVAGLSDEDGVTRSDVFESHLVLVVQGGEPHSRAAHPNRFEHGERSRLPGASD